MPSIEDVKQIPLQEISLATNGFAKENIIGKGGFGPVYKGISKKHGCIAVKRLVHTQSRPAQGDHEFKTEIAMLSKYKHENIASLLGFCDEEGEKILVYKYESNGSLDRHLSNKDLTWIQRIWICLDVACALKYLHDNVGSQLGIHRDVKSSNILLDEKWKAKISDLGLSRARPSSMQASFLISNPCGTPGYIDPDYCNAGYLTPKSDVYSFGVVLWEVLCGRLTNDKSYNDDRQFLTVWVRKHYKRETLGMIIPSYLHKQMNVTSLEKFSKIAYQCLKNVEERPTMEQVVEQLQEALNHQLEVQKPDEEPKMTTGDEKKGADLEDPPPPHPQSQDIILGTFLHCEGCARKVKRCLKGFDGVKDVVTDCETRQVVVKGEKADPIKVLKKVQKEIPHRKVELLSMVPKSPAEVPKKLEQGEPSKREEKDVKKLGEGNKAKEKANSTTGDDTEGEESKDLPPPPQSQAVVLSVLLHCKGCASKVRKCLEGYEGVESVVMDLINSEVVIKGTFPTAELVDYVHKKTGKEIVIVKQDPY